MKSIEELEDRLSQPSEELIRDLGNIDGDILILGVGGKMGPSLALLAQRASQASSNPKRIIGVSRFSEGGLREQLEDEGIKPIPADLMIKDDLQSFPEVKNVIYMGGKNLG